MTSFKPNQTNQGIIDGRPQGCEPESTPVLDTVFDPDASGSDADPAPAVLTGATSKDVHQGLGMPVQEMTSNELRHDGQRGRKHHGGGITQFGEGEVR